MVKRIITAVVAVALFIPVLYFSDTYVFPAAMSLLATIAAFEMLKCLGTLQNWAFSIPQIVISAALPFLMRLGSEDAVYIRSAIFKLLPYKEEGYAYLDRYFGSVLQLLKGFNEISGYQPEVVSIISKIAYAREEKDFQNYRKAILDACGMVERIKESEPDA